MGHPSSHLSSLRAAGRQINFFPSMLLVLVTVSELVYRQATLMEVDRT